MSVQNCQIADTSYETKINFEIDHIEDTGDKPEEINFQIDHIVNTSNTCEEKDGHIDHITNTSNKTKKTDDRIDHIASKSNEPQTTDGRIEHVAKIEKFGVGIDHTASSSNNAEEMDDLIDHIVEASDKTERIDGEIDPSAFTSYETDEKCSLIEHIVYESNETQRMDDRKGYYPGTKQMTLNWIDELNDAISYDFREMFIGKHKTEFEKYKIEISDNLTSSTDRDTKIIIVCRRSTSRLEHNLDYFMGDIDSSLFDRVLVIIVHNNGRRETPRVPTKSKIGHLQQFKELKHIIDVSYKSPTLKNILMDLFCCRCSRTQTIFGEDIFQRFLGNSVRNEQ